MLEELTEVGFTFALLAFIGFLLNDAFNSGKYLEIPITKKSSLEIIFHYCSISVFAVSIVIGLAFPLIRDNPDIKTDPSVLNSLTILFALAILYIIVWLFVSTAGLYDRYFSLKFVYATYMCCGSKVREKFPSVLIIDDDYVYFEKFDRNCWKCIPKNSLIQMETKLEMDTRFKLGIIRILPQVKEYSTIIKIFLILAMVGYFASFSLPFLPLTIILAIVIIICVLLLF
jgi:hypothetical protein